MRRRTLLAGILAVALLTGSTGYGITLARADVGEQSAGDAWVPATRHDAAMHRHSTSAPGGMMRDPEMRAVHARMIRDAEMRELHEAMADSVARARRGLHGDAR